MLVRVSQIKRERAYFRMESVEIYVNREGKEYCRKTSLEIRIRIRKMNVKGSGRYISWRVFCCTAENQV